jgi:hypothetical protein
MKRLIPFLVLVLPACGGGGGGSLEIDGSPSKNASAGDLYTVQLEAEHAEGSREWSLLVAPTGVTISQDGLLRWAPGVEDLGRHLIRVVLRARTASASMSWHVTVDQGVLMGVSFSPRGHTAHSTETDVRKHFDNHEPYGRVIAFPTNWRDSIELAGAIPEAAVDGLEAARDFHFTPAIAIGWTDAGGQPDLASQSEPGNNTWSNQETRDEFLAMVRDLAEEWQPPVLILGTETNTYWLTHTPLEWAGWITELNLCYDAVKAVSPNTQVCTTFQYERLRGGGRRNGWNDPPQWNLLDELGRVVRVDAAGFTSYPYFDHDTPDAIPADYYDPIAARWGGAVWFSGTGWLSRAGPVFPGSEPDQAAFVDLFFARTSGLRLMGATWLFLHDWDGEAATPAFAGIGFRDNLATDVRRSDSEWRSAVSLRERRSED